jgi:hypothetical protein
VVTKLSPEVHLADAIELLMRRRNRTLSADRS